LSAESRDARRARVVDEAIGAHKIPPERREDYERKWDANPTATEALLRELAPGLPPSSFLLSGEGLPADWFAGGSRRPSLSAERGSTVRASGSEDDGGLPWVARFKPAQHGRVTLARDE
jgi:hypothetical protein